MTTDQQTQQTHRAPSAAPLDASPIASPTPDQAPSWPPPDVAFILSGAIDEAHRGASSAYDALASWRIESIAAPYGVDYERVRGLACGLMLELEGLRVAAARWEAEASRSASQEAAQETPAREGAPE